MSKNELILDAINKTTNRNNVKTYDVVVILKDGYQISAIKNHLVQSKNTQKTPQERVAGVCRKLIWNRKTNGHHPIDEAKDERIRTDLSLSNIKKITVTPTWFKS